MLAIYTRLSREDDDSHSIENQIREGKDFAKSRGLSFKIFDEGEGVSGTLQIEDRPVLLDLVTQVQDGVISMVWMRNQNRLSRDEYTYHGFIAQMIKYDIEVYFDNKLLDFNDPSQALLGSVLNSLNTYQAKLQSHQTKKVLRKNASEGKAHGILPYGYSRDTEGKLIVDEEERKIVERIYALSLSGVGSRTIARQLTEEGIPTRYNKLGKGTISTKNKFTGKIKTKDKTDVKWSGKTVIDIIKNTTNKGYRTFGGTQYDTPRIVTPSYWQKVNDNLKNNRNNTGKKVEHKYLLKGLLRCAKCGSNYYGRAKTNDPKGYIVRISQSGKKRIDYNVYMCSSKRYSYTNCGSKSLRLKDFDSLIWGVFFKEETLIKKIKNYFENLDIDSEQEKANEKLKKLKSKIGDLNRQKQKAIDLAIKDIVSEADLKATMNSINSNLTSFKEQLEAITTYLDNIQSSSKTFVKKIYDLENIKYKIDFKDKREIIHKYIDDIVIYTHFDDPTNSFVQIDVYYKDNLLSPDKFLFNLKQGIAVNLFNEKVISLHHPIDERYYLELIQPIINEVQRLNKNVQK
ncbi:recombinase family protein [Hyunsoonleella rubra]|uniref:Recombinase family protein n=1 Tax=Hyunsoonleella rubra TaxID=1737062 RepID=A0ABW5TCP2_9FLAO